MRGRAKPKRNPNAICYLCKNKIYNRLRGTLYCKDCSNLMNQVKNKVWCYISRKVKSDFKLKVKIDVEQII